MQVCPELEMAVLSLAQFMPADYQLEAAKRIVEVYGEWLQSQNDRSDVPLAAADFVVKAQQSLITDAYFTDVD